jgi:hypothetical protein
MPVKMVPHELAFWRELLAPFDDNQLSVTKRGGKDLTYVDRRSVYNRLNSVCGPSGRRPEFEATARGYKCRLSILCATYEVDVYDWTAKEDGAGFEEIGSNNTKTGESEADVDNDEKSGYTNASRCAALDGGGIGRHFYRKDIPSFLASNAVTGQAPTPPPVAASGQAEPSAPPARRPRRAFLAAGRASRLRHPAAERQGPVGPDRPQAQVRDRHEDLGTSGRDELAERERVVAMLRPRAGSPRKLPSGLFCWRDGTFQDRKDNSAISFFDLGVVLGKYARWQDCRDGLGQRYIGRRCVRATRRWPAPGFVGC